MRLMRRVLVLLCVFLCAGQAFALSDEHYKGLMARCPEFVEAEQYLSAKWAGIKEHASKADYERYLADQRHWLKEGRDKEVEAALEYHARTGRIPHHVTGAVFGPDQAYALVTFERAVQLTMLLAQIRYPGSELTLAGYFHKKHGYYWIDHMGWWNFFRLFPERDFAKQEEGTRRLMQRAMEENRHVYFTGSLALPGVFDLSKPFSVRAIPEGMAWRELDAWELMDETLFRPSRAE